MKQVSVERVDEMGWPVLEPVEAEGVPRPIALHKPVCVAGGKPEANLVIGSSSISRVHALLVNDADAVYIRDLASRNRVFLNNVEVREAVLDNGDLLALGPATFRCKSHFNHHAREMATPDLELHRLDTAAKVLVKGRTAVLGRRSKCDVQVSGEQVAPVHAVIFKRQGRWFIRNLATATGTRVNGSPVGDSELKAGDLLRIGRTEFQCIVGGVGSNLAQDEDDASPTQIKSSEETVAVAADDLLHDDATDSEELSPADLEDLHLADSESSASQSHNLHLSHLEDVPLAAPNKGHRPGPTAQRSWRDATSQPAAPAQPPAARRPVAPLSLDTEASVEPHESAALPEDASHVGSYSQLELSDSQLPDLRHMAFMPPARLQAAGATGKAAPSNVSDPSPDIGPERSPPVRETTDAQDDQAEIRVPQIDATEAPPRTYPQTEEWEAAIPELVEEPIVDSSNAAELASYSVIEPEVAPLDFSQNPPPEPGPLDLTSSDSYLTPAPEAELAGAETSAPIAGDAPEPREVAPSSSIEAPELAALPVPALDDPELEFSEMLQKLRKDLDRLQAAWDRLVALRRREVLDQH
jgi:pSer/pThr/pTyr-binding forkhead associated (FHA) protein